MLTTKILSSVRAMPVPVRISTFLFLAADLVDGMLLPSFALWAVREAGVPVAAVSLLLGCYAGGELLANPFVGGLSDRLGRRPVMLGSTLGARTQGLADSLSLNGPSADDTIDRNVAH